MKPFVEKVIQSFAASRGDRRLDEGAWYVLPGKAGPNAVLKIVLPPRRREHGFVLTVARHRETPVVKHEVDVLRRLRETLPASSRDAIPEVLGSGQVDGRDYFALPYYTTHRNGRMIRWLTRPRRSRWIIQWMISVGASTRGVGLTRASLEKEFGETLERVLKSTTVTDDVKERLRTSVETVQDQIDHVPSVCCHGDFSMGNILWQRGGGAVVIDWGAARWPGLPCVDLCRFALQELRSDIELSHAIRSYSRAVGIQPGIVPALYDVYLLFVKAELDLAFANQPSNKIDPFSTGRNAAIGRLARSLSHPDEGLIVEVALDRARGA